MERTTRTQFVAGGYRFKKDSGNQIGGAGWRFARVFHPTPELLAEVKTEHRYRQAANDARQLRVQVETLLREIDRNPNPHRWAATIEAAAEHLAAAVERLQLRVEEPATPPTPQTPEPPAAGELTSDDIPAVPLSKHELREQWNAQDGTHRLLITWKTGSTPAWAQARARAIAADRAQRHQAEQMVEALLRFRRWGGHLGWDAQVVDDLEDWIDTGMTGPLPPLPEHLARGRQ